MRAFQRCPRPQVEGFQLRAGRLSRKGTRQNRMQRTFISVLANLSLTFVLEPTEVDASSISRSAISTPFWPWNCIGNSRPIVAHISASVARCLPFAFADTGNCRLEALSEFSL